MVVSMASHLGSVVGDFKWLLVVYTQPFIGRVRIRLETTATDALNMRTESRLSCRGAHAALSTNVDVETASTHDDAASHSSDGNTPLRMTFRLRNRRVEVEQATNTWASECQSKASFVNFDCLLNRLFQVVQRLVDGCDQWFIVLEDVVSSFRRPCMFHFILQSGKHCSCRCYGPQDGHSTTWRQCDRREATAATSEMSSIDERGGQSTSTCLFCCNLGVFLQCGVRLAGMQLYDRASSTFMRSRRLVHICL